MQHKAVYYSASSLYMFRVSTTPIIRSAQNCNYSLQYWLYFCAAARKIWRVAEAVVTVLCTPDDGCGWHPKHVEWTCRIINRLFRVASRWTITNIDNTFIFNDLKNFHQKRQTSERFDEELLTEGFKVRDLFIEIDPLSLALVSRKYYAHLYLLWSLQSIWETL